jgi:hypothetical protein
MEAEHKVKSLYEVAKQSLVENIEALAVLENFDCSFSE